MTIYVNFYGGPGTGKSSMALGTTAALKMRGVDAEYVDEFVKGHVWRGDHTIFENQPYAMVSQFDRLNILFGKTDVVVTDSPLLLGLHYMKKFPSTVDKSYRELLLDIHYKVMLPRSMDFMMVRDFEYKEAGRYQNEAEANIENLEIREIVEIHTGGKFKEARSSISDVMSVVSQVVERLNAEK